MRLKPQRRRFSATYKLALLRRADACRVQGELAALLRREGLYSSQLATWRKQREAGELAALSPQVRGRKPEPPNPLTERVTELEREVARLQKKLHKAETLLEVQKKL